MNTSSSGSDTAQIWDGFSDVLSNQTGLDFSFPWTKDEVYFLKVVSSIRLGIIVMNLLSNTFTLYLEVRHKLYRRPSYIFAITLTTADLAHSCALALEWFNRQSVPWYVTAVVLSSGTLSMLSASAVAVDRYLALHAIPLKYKQFVTVKKYAIAALFIMMLAIACGSTISVAFPYHHPVVSWCNFASSIVFVSVTMTFYVALGCFLSKSHSKLQLPPETKLRRLHQMRKILLTFFAITLTNFILFTPNYMYSLYIALQPDHKKYSVYLNVLLANISYTIAVSNYTVNAFIFTTSFLRPYLPRLCRGKTMKEGNGSNSGTNRDVGGTSVGKNKASVYSVSVELKSVPAFK